MQLFFRNRGGVPVSVLLLTAALFAAGCGGGSSPDPGNRDGENTAPVVLGLQTPLGIQGTRGVGPNIQLVYRLRDREFDDAQIEVEYGVDRDGDGVITEGEYVAATEGPGSEGTTNLSAAPGSGSLHSYVWSSPDDVETGRYVTQDYVYTQDGRVAKDQYGDDIFQSFPGVVFRVRAEDPKDGTKGAWTYTDPFQVNNNNPPSVTIDNVRIPPEGLATSTVNEEVLVDWTAMDQDSDRLTIAVDWVLLPETYDYTTKTPEELAADLEWKPALSSATMGEGTFLLSSSASGSSHVYAWDSLGDGQAGAVKERVLLRIQPIDEKLEVGDVVYLDPHMALNNFSTFTNPQAALPNPRVGAQATLLAGGPVLVTGGSGTTGGVGTPDAYIFYPGTSQTTLGSVAPVPGGMTIARVGHTATRLQPEEDPTTGLALPAKVLIVGGTDGGGTVLGSAEIYDPATNSFAGFASELNPPRVGHVAVLLRSGNVLIAGGTDDAGNALATAEIYDVELGEFRPLASSFPADEMQVARTRAEGVLLPSGRVLIVGGTNGTDVQSSIEIFDEDDGEIFDSTDVNNDMDEARIAFTLSPTLDSTYPAVAAGGMASPPTDTLERYDPAAATSWVKSAQTMRSPRANHLGVLMGDGTILLAGGQTNESGSGLTDTADVYDPANDTMDLPFGDLPEPVRGTCATCLVNGRVVIFGGETAAGGSGGIRIFTPQTETGFNYAPRVQIRTPVSVEPHAFGVRFYYRLTDIEGDPARIVAQYKVKTSASDDTGSLNLEFDKWLPATMKAGTVLGDVSSGLTNLPTTDTWVPQSGPGSNPIDTPYNPQAPNDPFDPGENLFVWDTAADLPKGDYDNVFFRIIAFGATEGETAKSAKFGITKNAPVIVRIEDPLTDPTKVFGNVVFPFYLQDSDAETAGDLAKVVWEYGIDTTGDGKIIDTDGEVWVTATHATVSRTIGSTTYTDAGETGLITGGELTDLANNDKTVNGIPWGKRHDFIWDSVYDLGSPLTPRGDVVVRCTAYDYPPADPTDLRLGIAAEKTGFDLDHDPDGLWLESWTPTVNTIPDPSFSFAGVKTNEPITFNFSAPVAPLTANKNTIRVYEKGGATLVSGYFATDNSSGKGVVTFYPQAQELPIRPDVLEENTGYTVEIKQYDPNNRTQPLVQRLNANAADTNALNMLLSTSVPNAFMTGYGATDLVTGAPAFTSLTTPSSGDTGVAVDTDIVAEFGERLDHASVDFTSFSAWAEGVSGVYSVIPGAFRLSNVVDSSGEWSRLTFEPSVDLPPGTRIEIRYMSGLTDLAGNGLPTTSAPFFTTILATGSQSPTMSEGFTTSNRLDATQTTAFWGTTDPAIPGPFSGYGVSGTLKGLFDYGDGSDNSITGGTSLATTSSKNVWLLKELTIPSGHTLTITGTHPATFRVQGAVKIDGTVRVNGNNGSSGFYRTSTGTFASGGTGGAGGGKGGGGQSYTVGAKTPTTGADGYNYKNVLGGTGAGKGGPGWYRSYGYYYGVVAGGGGGGHGSAGGDGQKGYSGLGLSGGAGGASYGSSTLANGPEGGSGGGSGGNVITTYGANRGTSGGGGGGGGGAVLMVAKDGITLGTSSTIETKGGNGGTTSYHYYSGLMFGGGGGGGSGGSVGLMSANLAPNGTINVSGGNGGVGYGTNYGYPNNGGDGAGGRLVFGTSKTSWMVSGVISAGAATVVHSSTGTSNWTATTSVTVDTEKGTNGIGYSTTDHKFYVKNFTVNSGVTLTAVGKYPFVVMASGDVDIQGNIVSSGEEAGQMPGGWGYYSSTQWLVFHEWTYSTYAPGPTRGDPGAGGGIGGKNCDFSSSANILTTYYGYYTMHSSLPSAEDGWGFDSKNVPSKTGTGGGKGGKPVRKTYSTSYATYYYYYYPGAGGGGGAAEQGDDGTNRVHSTYGGGTSGKGGPAVTTASTLSFANLKGGGGGGGGAPGGYYYTRSSYKYCQGQGTGGGGGGGAIGIAAKGDMTVAGGLDVHGGRGGTWSYSSFYTTKAGGGGGGGGGNVLLHADGTMTIAGPVINAAGGAGGFTRNYTYTWYYTEGGAGGKGAIRLTGKTAPALPALSLDPSKIILGKGGTVGSTAMALSDTAVSTWQDAASLVPTFTSLTSTGTGVAQLLVQGAHTDPVTGKADETNSTAWVNSSNLSALQGYRWFRFKVILTTVSGSYPSVTNVTVGWTYDT